MERRKEGSLTSEEKTANLKLWPNKVEMLLAIDETYERWLSKTGSEGWETGEGCPLCSKCQLIRQHEWRKEHSVAGYSKCNYCPVVIIHDMPCYDSSDMVMAELTYPYYQTAIRNILHQLNILTLEIAKLEDW